MFLEADLTPSPLSRKERGSQNPPQPSLFTGRESEVDIMNELGEIIREEIGARGPMTFARYMELALYHPALGYYAGGAEGREPLGWSGDYFTSGDVSPLWGWAMARRLRQMWETLGRPDPFTVVEPGGGRGLLARDVWRYALSEDQRMGGRAALCVAGPGAGGVGVAGGAAGADSG